MVTLMTRVYGEIEIPDWVVDLKSFLRWYHSGVLPEKLKVHYIAGRIWVDLSMEEMFSHNRVKTGLGLGLCGLIERAGLGVYVTDGMLFRNDDADLGTGPDAMFLSNESLAARRVWFSAGKSRGAQATELVGTPDLVVEIVSPSSEDKDTEKLMSAYHDAGIPEYWLIDARAAEVQFDIYRRRTKGFVAARKADGWVKSAVLKKSFRLTRTGGPHGIPSYDLEVR